MNDKEFAIIKEISSSNNASQRCIARKTGFSLGLTNIIIRRLVRKGYIKTQQFPPNRIKYLITPKGFTEKARKAYNFTLETINSLNKMKSSIQQIIVSLHSRGADNFKVIGSNELVLLTEIAFREAGLKKVAYNYSDNPKKSSCIVYFDIQNKREEVDILSQISNSATN